MRRIASSVVFLALMWGAVQAQETPPDVLVKTVTTEVAALIAGDAEIRAGGRAKLIEIIEGKVLPHFNFSAMTALAMGQNWRKADDPSRSKRLSRSSGCCSCAPTRARLPPTATRSSISGRCARKPTDTDVTVRCASLQSGAQPVSIDYSMEKTRSGLEGVRRDGRRREPGGELPHRVQQHGARRASTA
jgi:phospholipid transport system substrate-binding protein